MDQNLENSMAVDISQITIPMSLNDFAKRERFNVAFGLLKDTFARLEVSAKMLNGSGSWDTVKRVDHEISAYIKTMNSIIKSIDTGVKDE